MFFIRNAQYAVLGNLILSLLILSPKRMIYVSFNYPKIILIFIIPKTYEAVFTI